MRSFGNNGNPRVRGSGTQANQPDLAAKTFPIAQNRTDAGGAVEAGGDPVREATDDFLSAATHRM